MSKFASVMNLPANCRRREPRAARRGAALVLAGEQAGGEREERQQAEPVALHHGEMLLVEIALEQAVLVLAEMNALRLRCRAAHCASIICAAEKFEQPM